MALEVKEGILLDRDGQPLGNPSVRTSGGAGFGSFASFKLGKLGGITRGSYSFTPGPIGSVLLMVALPLILVVGFAFCLLIGTILGVASIFGRQAALTAPLQRRKLRRRQAGH